MAIIYPSIDQLDKLRVKPTDGERSLLEQLCTNLSDDYEVFFNPYLDGDRPDIIILKQDVGAFIIEIKDWALSSYHIDENNKWTVIAKKDFGKSSPIKSPQSQAFRYKQNLYDLHLPILGIKELSNKNFFNVVHCFVYFHCASENELKSKYTIVSNAINESKKKENSAGVYNDAYQRKIDYLSRKQKQVTRDKSMSYGFDETFKLFKKINCTSKHILFNDEIYNDFKRRLQPPLHVERQGQKIDFDEKQKKLLTSSIGKRKVKGVAGCGKTSIMANLAVNAFSRVNTTVLILTFNITLKNHIRDKISEILNHRNFTNYEVTNYHQFYNAQVNNHNLDMGELVQRYGLRQLYSHNIFSSLKDTIKYDVILLDEVQDYEPEWVKIIRDNFLHNNGEMVLFGDQSQNIYGRDEGRASVIAQGFGTWNSLNKSYRTSFDSPLNSLFQKFQKAFLIEKHPDSDDFNVTEEQSTFNFDLIKFHKFSNIDSSNKVHNDIKEYIKSYNLHPNDIIILSSRINILREINELWLESEKTHTMFETIHELAELTRIDKSTLSGMSDLELENVINNNIEIIEQARRRKKNHFYQNSGLIKLSSTHSFKGLESKTVFCIINNQDSPEIVFTGITRAINNLIIFDLSQDDKYSSFFNNELGS